MVSENKGNPFVDLFFFVFQEVVSVNFTEQKRNKNTDVFNTMNIVLNTCIISLQSSFLICNNLKGKVCDINII
jgi:hypothetical protein